MSYVSYHYFLTGLDFSMRKDMENNAFQINLSPNNPAVIGNYHIASQWQDLPSEIQNNLNPQNLVEGVLIKKVVGNPLFSKPEKGYFAMKVIQNGEIRFISNMFFAADDDGNNNSADNELSPFLSLAIIALLAMILFAVTPYLILRKVAIPIEKLMSWAKKLNKQQLKQAPPEFHYSELNSLAGILQSSLLSVQESLDREQQFLGYASHELRTPIAVTRTNTELLRKMIEKEVSTEKQLQVLDRIDRAGLNMTDLTETLLWLNRKADKSIPVKSISIGQVTEQLTKELSYLLTSKNIELIIKTDIHEQLLPEVLCRIIINNLIRNAFQHTQEGKIIITQSKNKLVIHNQHLSQSQQDNELGFGLGLELTQRLVKHYDWQYHTIAKADSHYVEVIFN